MSEAEMNEVMEPNVDEMETVNGGRNRDSFVKAAGATAPVGARAGAVIGICAGPVGWCVLGGAVLPADACGTVSGVRDDIHYELLP